jgi:hypothetical protein
MLDMQATASQAWSYGSHGFHGMLLTAAGLAHLQVPALCWCGGFLMCVQADHLSHSHGLWITSGQEYRLRVDFLEGTVCCSHQCIIRVF